MEEEPFNDTITMRLECNNFNAIDKKMIEDWLNWLDENNLYFKGKGGKILPKRNPEG